MDALNAAWDDFDLWVSRNHLDDAAAALGVSNASLRRFVIHMRPFSSDVGRLIYARPSRLHRHRHPPARSTTTATSPSISSKASTSSEGADETTFDSAVLGSTTMRVG